MKKQVLALGVAATVSMSAVVAPAGYAYAELAVVEGVGAMGEGGSVDKHGRNCWHYARRAGGCGARWGGRGAARMAEAAGSA